MGKTRMVFAETKSRDDIGWKRTAKRGYDGIVLSTS